jgi:DNA mismatch repair protein MutL
MTDDASICRLEDDAVRRIAAGEVITRPTAVVKELVENALDAGAGSVEVAVAGDGTDRIAVKDDGHGMTERDALRAFERHATSKIEDADDVDAVSTLGFRGEALPAIADAGTVELLTKTRAEDARAVRVSPDGTVAPAARAPGTTVTVTDLFADRPARRKSLASARTEFARVSDLVSGYALAHPDVRFRLDHDGSRTFTTPGSGDPVDALLAVYDREVAGAAVTVDPSDAGAETEGGGPSDREAPEPAPATDGGVGAVTVEGAVVRPSITRAKAGHVHVAVNGRPLRDGDLREAVVDGYGSLLPDDRYPVVAVSVSVPPEAVDVNVHPAKEEVAFAAPGTVTDAVTRAVRETLSTEDLTRRSGLGFDPEESLTPVDGSSDLADVSVVGVFRDLYVLCEREDRLLVVDAHAAHERVNFERLRSAVGDRPDSATVDPPATVALTPGERAALSDPATRNAVEASGFRLTVTDDGRARVRSVPAPMGQVADATALRDTLDRVREGENKDPRTELLRELACHPSIEAGDDLDIGTADRLIERLGACEQPYACPHGRPTVLSIEEADFARGFDRQNTRFD